MIEIEEINLHEIMPVIRRGSRGLCHIGSNHMRQLSADKHEIFMTMLMNRAEQAGVILMTKQVNDILMIGWAP